MWMFVWVGGGGSLGGCVDARIDSWGRMWMDREGIFIGPESAEDIPMCRGLSPANTTQRIQTPNSQIITSCHKFINVIATFRFSE